MAVPTANDLQPVIDVTSRLRALLQQANNLKPEGTVDPPLPVADLIQGVHALHDDFTEDRDQSFRNATIETAARNIFYAVISSTDIQDPAFVEVWNLLDVLLVCSDEGKCTPELACWLIEELLDSQTTHGCRIVFDYLETRRERLAQKDFHKKNLVFLRSCNELLRRLSRAEDAIFCGRVFFFLFQTFPLGDKSSVNLRGEFHTENTTKFEVASEQADQDGDKMEIDAEPPSSDTATPKAGTPQPPTKPGSKAVPVKAPPKKEEEVVLSSDALYSIFWRLQQDFSDPTRLFSANNFQLFKKGLDRTITKFKKTPTVVQTHASGNSQRGTKRKVGEDNTLNDLEADGSQLVDSYNPKYLTSRDLFDLELSDLAFQRHILVQALILIDFLLSLTEKAKKRLAALETTNKSMLYSFTLSEEDSKWAVQTRSNITSYLSSSPEGRLFNRMVETVLARDKNWIRWKVESCPSIVKDPASTESEIEARKRLRDATKIRRLSERPPVAMDVSFLDEGQNGGLAALKNPSRYTVPIVDDLLEGIQTDELDLDFAEGEEKIGLQNAMSNKRWKLLRQTRATRLKLLDKVEPDEDLRDVFRSSAESQNAPKGLDADVEPGVAAQDEQLEDSQPTERMSTLLDNAEQQATDLDHAEQRTTDVDAAGEQKAQQPSPLENGEQQAPEGDVADAEQVGETPGNAEQQPTGAGDSGEKLDVE
ncbi:uncharacterized protein LTR77_005447 [Saxophila tyrrhenica]|uniref:THO complex subunit 1 n=1 Tax=Saxophila tyrrhenica TaxID=1690608 RepID=A0AAV9P8I1_9PEZI|nr:hypothetical protein LTR77_005447 [Saxophila tyrrhenica]